MRKVFLAIFLFLFIFGPAQCRADGVAGTSPAGSNQGRLLPDVSFLPVAKSYGEYLASVGHPPRGMSDLPQSLLAGGTADMEVRGAKIQLSEVEAEKPTITEHLAANERLPAGSYVRHESGLDWELGEGWRLVGNDGLTLAGPETFVGFGYRAGDVTVAVTTKLRGEEASEEDDLHGPRPLPVGLTIQTRW